LRGNDVSITEGKIMKESIEENRKLLKLSFRKIERKN